MASRTLGDEMLVALLVCALFLGGGAGEEEIGSPLRVAQCRARCIQRFSRGASSQESCLQGKDCYMCWDNCQLLQSNFALWGAICDKKGICFPGCKEACQFQKEAGSEQQRAPVIQTRGEEVIEVSEEGVASWPEPSRARGPLVYVVMRRVPGGPWRQLVQTVERSARLPPPPPPPAPALRVLVVNRDGLLTIYSPLSPGLASARAVLSTLGKDPLRRLGYPVPDLPPPPQSPGKRINTEILPTTHRPLSLLEDSSGEGGGDDAWNLREVSLIHQKVLVIAEIAWEPRSSGQRSVYFVTWEVDGGGLKGNLFTDSTCVTLSLWPNTIYHIQVELVRQDSVTERSEELVVDTQRAVGVEMVSGPQRVPATRPQHGLRAELALGASAALALFLLLLGLALLYSARGRSHNTDHKLLDSPHDPHRVFPPVVTVVGGSASPPPNRTRTLHV